MNFRHKSKMEAVPKLPLIHFKLKISPATTEFSYKLKDYIRNHYNEDPEAYNKEIKELETLRQQAACNVQRDFTGCSILKKYYSQLHLLQKRFPMSTDEAASVSFIWIDVYSGSQSTVTDVKCEQACILHNIGALHSELGAIDNRQSSEGMKISCTHFQCAAWAFQHLRDSYPQPRGTDMSHDILTYYINVMLGQAQECILEKSMLDNRKCTIVAKIAAQIVEYYRLALKILDGANKSAEGSNVATTVGSKIEKSWRKYLEFKISYHNCITYLYLGSQAEEMQKMGERVAYYQAALDKLNEAMKLSKGLDEDLSDAMTFTMDIVGGKFNAASKENEFVYHEKVPSLDSLSEVKGASLVKGIQFDPDDPEISGPNIFAHLVPMKAHEAASLYSEEKAKIIRQIDSAIDAKNDELDSFMSSLQLEQLKLTSETDRLPQELVDCCAVLSAKPDAVKELVSAMKNLSGMFHDVESILQEIDATLEEEKRQEKECQDLIGKRPPSMILLEIKEELNKYQEAHRKANESNLTLHKAMDYHIGNLNVLSGPIDDLFKVIPSLAVLEASIDERSKNELRRLLEKVEEMKSQRTMLKLQLREQIHSDDITKQLVTREDMNLKETFAQELKKHDKQVSLIGQNLSAQNNILRALTEANARYADTRRATNELTQRRHAIIAGLISSYEAYEDLIAKSQKGLDFYRKLEMSASKLLKRLRSVCKVQEEERDKILESQVKKATPKQTAAQKKPRSVSLNTGPKLKDYLQLMTGGGSSGPFVGGVAGLHDASSLSNVPNTMQSFPNSSIANDSRILHDRDAYSSVYNSYVEPDNLYSVSRLPTELRPAPVGSEHTEALPSTCRQPFNSSRVNNIVSDPYAKGIQNYDGVNNSQLSAAYNTQPSASQAVPSTAATNYANYYGYSNMTSTSNQISNDTTSTSRYSNHQQGTNYYSTVGSRDTGYPTSSASVWYPSAVTGSAREAPPTSTGYGAYGSAVSSSGLSTQVQSYTPWNSYSTAQSTVPTSQMQNMQSYGVNTHSSVRYSDSHSNLTHPPTSLNTYSQVNNNSAMSYSQQNQSLPTAVAEYSTSTAQYGSNTHYTPYSQVSNAITTQSYTGPIQYQAPVQSHYPANTGGYTEFSTAPSNSYSGYYQSQSQNVLAEQQTYSQNVVPVVANPQTPQYPNSVTYNQSNYSTPMNPVASVSSVPTPTSKPAAPDSNVSLLQQLDFTLPTNTSSTSQSHNNNVILSTNQMPAASGSSSSSSSSDSIVKSDLLSGTTDTLRPNSEAEVPVLKPKVLTVDDIMKQNREKDREARCRATSRDPFSDSEILERFVAEVERFQKVVEGLSKQSLNGPTPLEQKWKELSEAQDRETRKLAISVARCYSLKNRVPDIMPYDNSRVEITSLKDDYINASHVKKLSKNTAQYIATQAPLSATIRDFWIMVFEQQTEVVAALVNDAELKGDIYYPTEKGQAVDHGVLLVTLNSYKLKPWGMERIISIMHRENKISRTVVHLQLTSWPPGSIPTSPALFLQFVADVHSFHRDQRNTSRPVVVHCSAGVGRTGVFCLVSTAIHEILAGNGIVDLWDLALRLVQMRKYVMQDKEHMRFALHSVLYFAEDVLLKRGILIKRASFDDIVPSVVSRKSSHTRNPSQDFVLPPSHDDKTGMEPANAKSNESNGSGTDVGASSPVKHPLKDDTKSISSEGVRSRSSSTASIASAASFGSSAGSGLVAAISNISPQHGPPLSAKGVVPTCGNLPPSLANLDAANFTLDPMPRKGKKITKESFLSIGGSLSDQGDPNDPLSQLDPLWSLNK